MRESDRGDSVILRGARVVTPGGVIEGADLFIEDGRIARISEGMSSGESAREVFELAGATLLPGFIDMHAHGALGVDVNEGEADGLRKVSAFLATHGVTAWLPTLVPAPDSDYARAARAVASLMREQDEQGSAPAARALGLHYEGPFVNEHQCGALRTQFFRACRSPADLDSLARVAHEGALHMTTLAPEVEGGVELVRELCARGWAVAIGHTRADIDALEAARRAGARHVTHFFNAMTPLHHRAPGPIGWGLLRDDVTCDIIADGVHLDPLVISLVLRCKTADRVALISDSVAPAGLGDGEFNMWGETIRVESGRTRNERGDIAGSVINVLDAVRLVSSLGCGPQAIARMASHVPARVLGIAKDYGTIEEGKRADLVALDERMRVRLTIVGGRVVRRKEATSDE